MYGRTDGRMGGHGMSILFDKHMRNREGQCDMYAAYCNGVPAQDSSDRTDVLAESVPQVYAFILRCCYPHGFRAST